MAFLLSCRTVPSSLHVLPTPRPMVTVAVRAPFSTIDSRAISTTVVTIKRTETNPCLEPNETENSQKIRSNVPSLV